jgi:hypothetical protein
LYSKIFLSRCYIKQLTATKNMQILREQIQKNIRKYWNFDEKIFIVNGNYITKELSDVEVKFVNELYLLVFEANNKDSCLITGVADTRITIYIPHGIASLTFEQLYHNLLDNKNFWAKINLYQSTGLLTLSQILKIEKRNPIPVYNWSKSSIVLENRAIIKGFTRNEPLLVTANRKSAKDQLDISLTSMLDASILCKDGDEL